MNAQDAIKAATEALTETIIRHTSSDFLVISIQLNKRNGQYTLLETGVKLTKQLTSKQKHSK